MHFAGKVLLIFPSRVAERDARGVLVEFPSFENRGGIFFVSGRRLTVHNGEWDVREQVAIAWSAITHFFVFESRLDYTARATKGAAAASEGGV